MNINPKAYPPPVTTVLPTTDCTVRYGTVLKRTLQSAALASTQSTKVQITSSWNNDGSKCYTNKFTHQQYGNILG